MADPTEIGAGTAPEEDVAAAAERILREMRKAIVGQDELLEMLLVALLAGGHVLLEGVPGTAKTLAVRAFARACNVSFARIQFTPDLMPSDILGTSVFDTPASSFTFKPGPIFAGLVLADEVNRTPPKTQAALLEAMEERQVTVDGVSHRLPEPFMVCATQNPIEYEGTYPLPEAQLDRFLAKVLVGYPDAEQEAEILARWQAGFRATDLDTAGGRPVVDGTEIARLRAQVERVEAGPQVRQYIVAIARAGRGSRRLLLGPSPRAAIALMLAARALAAVRGRGFVTPDDVKELARPVLRHRILVRPESEIEGFTADSVLESVLDSVEVPR